MDDTNVDDVQSALMFARDHDHISDMCENLSLIDPFSNLLNKESGFLKSLNTLINMKNYSMFGDEKVSLTKQSKDIIVTIWTLFRKTISFFDVFTDAYLLYLVSRAKLMLFTVILSVSIACPYIISYSCGVKLFFVNRDGNKQFRGLKKLLEYLGMSPIGVLYFVFLDLFDIVFNYYQLFVMVALNKTEHEMKLLEETVANQLGMTRMDYEGIELIFLRPLTSDKRQLITNHQTTLLQQNLTDLIRRWS